MAVSNLLVPCVFWDKKIMYSPGRSTVGRLFARFLQIYNRLFPDFLLLFQISGCFLRPAKCRLNCNLCNQSSRKAV